MSAVGSLPTLVVEALASVCLSWTAWKAYRSRGQPSADPFLLLSATLAAWAISSIGATVVNVATVGVLELFFDVVQFGALLFLPVLDCLCTQLHWPRNHGDTEADRVAVRHRVAGGGRRGRPRQ